MTLDITEVTNTPSLEAIQRLQAVMMQMPNRIELEPKHHFAPGIYLRELFIPAGTVLTGKIHKTHHLNILAKGDITVWTEDGVKRLQAPQIIPSYPGAKRAGYAHSDTVWICVHSSDKTDLEQLEADLIEPELPLIEEGVSFPG
jgi:quercetin dioxygenase-like cupin family protein